MKVTQSPVPAGDMEGCGREVASRISLLLPCLKCNLSSSTELCQTGTTKSMFTLNACSSYWTLKAKPQ